MSRIETLDLGFLARVLGTTGSKHLDTELGGISPAERRLGLDKASSVMFTLKAGHLPKALCTAFKGELLKIGAGATAYPADESGDCELIVSCSGQHLQELKNSAGTLPDELGAIATSLLEAVHNYTRTTFEVSYPGGRIDLTSRTAVMGVVNVTPDSFSDGGDFLSTGRAIEHAFRLAEQGADIIDIGGESTRPGSDPVETSEEISRVLPVIEAVSPKLDAPVSIDTCKPEVAREAIAAGARIVNDVTGLRGNADMAEMVAEADVPLIVMHMKGEPKTMQENPAYQDLMGEVYAGLAGSVKTAESYGIRRDMLIIDPGIGFGKSFEDNLVILDRMHEFRSLGLPVCVGVSRKAFLGAVLGIAEPKDRLTGTVAASVIAIRGGARIIRVHDVREAVEAVRVADAVAAGRLPGER